MSRIKNLAKFSVKQLQEFFTSFDMIFSDIDGVMWNFTSSIQGATESLAKLSKLGKKIYLVTNNGIREVEYFSEKARLEGGLEISPDHVINPSKVIIWYLKKINFQGDVFAIVSDPFRNNLKKAGIQIVEKPKITLKNEAEILKEITDRPSVKAVIADFDSRCNWAKMALAVSCLKRDEVIYLTGALDKWAGEKQAKVLGPGPLLELIAKVSGKTPILCGKPSQVMKDYILDTCNVSDPRRCLFIGDTAEQDMKFASMCGFIKLFVETGCDSLEEVLKEKDISPDYYIPSLGQLFSTFEETEKKSAANHENRIR